MKCPKCGFENRPDAHFCKKCGQPLQAQVASPAVPTPPGPVCLACGATAKPGARFCPRCGRPLPAEPGQPIPPPAQPPAPPPSRAQPSTGPSMPSATPPPPPPPKRGSSRWVWVVGIIAVFLCIIILSVTAWFVVPKIIGGGEDTATPSPTAESTPTETPAVETLPTETPTTAAAPPTATPTEIPTTEPFPTATLASAVFDAQVDIAPSAAQLSTGDFLTITVTVINTGQVTFSNLRYQLLGQWDPYLKVIGPTVVVQEEVEVTPNSISQATFVLEASQLGMTTLQANVTMEVPDPPRFEGVLSDDIRIVIVP